MPADSSSSSLEIYPSSSFLTSSLPFSGMSSMTTTTASSTTSNNTGTSSNPSTNPIPTHHQIKVGILGCTGMVGQRFILLLSAHPWFVIHALGASSRSAGRTYEEAVKWKQTSPIPVVVREMRVGECKGEEFEGCEIVFSGLDAGVAGEIESSLRSSNLPIFSNAKNFRRDPHVPLIVPLVNPSHLSIIPQQQSLHHPPLTRGFIVTNANCSTTTVVIPLHALENAFGPLECVLITTMQAISGGGYPGCSAMDVLDNVVPFISGEEEKLEWETLKILGGIEEGEDGKTKVFDMHKASPLRVSASCNRVAVLDGHTSCVSVRFARRPPPSAQQVREVLAGFMCEAQSLGCPSAPRRAIVVHEEDDRPQPRLDRDFQGGAGVSVGRVRECRVLDVKFVVLGNNVAIGAATSSVINAEVAVLKGVVKVRGGDEE